MLLVGCGSEEQAAAPDTEVANQVVIYTAVDQPISQPILDDFEQETGIDVVVVTDAEAAKTVGLAERLRAEQANPQADVWWGNEVFYTINLAEEGVLEPYNSPAGADIPPLFRDEQNRWFGSGLRARVIVAAEGVTLDELTDLTDSQFRGQVAIARPTAGTTGGHVAALYVLWGEERARRFFQDLRANEVKVLGGNGPVAENVAAGTLVAGLTDNDDIANARANIGSAEMILPDQKTFGTLMMPTTVGLVKGGPNPDNARKLIDYLLSSDVEQKLKDAQFAIASVREAGEGGSINAMEVDYADVARVMPQAIREATAILEGREP